MKEGWKKVKLTEIGLLARGKSKHRPRDAAFLYGGQYPFIQTGDVKSANHKVYKYSTTYSEDGLKQSKLWPAGTLCITIAANIADTAILTFPACFPDSILGFIPDPNECDVNYMEYYLRSIKNNIKSYAIGSVQDNINLGTFDNLEISLPPLEEQRRIASILTALDDKIELNRRMNTTLEGIAGALWEEWFGKYVREGAELPEGWRWGKVGDMYKTTSGGTPSRANSEYYTEGTIDWVKSKELKDFFVIETEEKITEQALKNSSAKLLPKHSVLVAMYGATVGDFSILSHEATCNQAICAILPNTRYSYCYIFQFLMHQSAKIKNLAVGAAQQNISQDLILKLDILVPSDIDIQEYTKVAEPLFDNILYNINQNYTLTHLRDTLLPRLMRGE